MVDYQLGKAKKVDLTQSGFEYLYRGQEYSPVGKEVRDPIYFDMKKANRFNLVNHGIETMYCGFKPLTGIVECIHEFRLSSLRHSIKLGRSRLQELELITFKLNLQLNLVDLCDEGAFVRHRLKLNTLVLCSTKLHPESEDFANQAHKAGFDGIMFPTRQGVQKAVVIFGSSKSKMIDYEVIDRQSFWDVLQNNHTTVNDLNIKLIDDTKGYN